MKSTILANVAPLNDRNLSVCRPGARMHAIPFVNPGNRSRWGHRLARVQIQANESGEKPGHQHSSLSLPSPRYSGERGWGGGAFCHGSKTARRDELLENGVLPSADSLQVVFIPAKKPVLEVRVSVAPQRQSCPPGNGLDAGAGKQPFT